MGDEIWRLKKKNVKKKTLKIKMGDEIWRAIKKNVKKKRLKKNVFF